MKRKYILNYHKGGNKIYNLDKLKGCLYGIFIGDALGSRYEFLEKNDSVNLIEKDMKNSNLEILGGGPFNVIAGQITDDSEMTLCLLKIIVENNGYNQEKS